MIKSAIILKLGNFLKHYMYDIHSNYSMCLKTRVSNEIKVPESNLSRENIEKTENLDPLLYFYGMIDLLKYIMDSLSLSK